MAEIQIKREALLSLLQDLIQGIQGRPLEWRVGFGRKG